jgi:hypothetical protein
MACMPEAPMFPCFFVWAPQFHLPLSGSVAQRIEPDTEWFFGAIDPAAGDGQVERQAFEIASYGRQLGLIADVLLDLAAQQAPDTARGRESLARLADIQARIARIKGDAIDTRIDDILAQVEALKTTHAHALPRLRQSLAGLLGAD